MEQTNNQEASCEYQFFKYFGMTQRRGNRIETPDTMWMQGWSTTRAGVESEFSVFRQHRSGFGVAIFFENPEPDFNFLNKSVLLWFKRAIPATWTRVKQKLEFKIFAKTGCGAGVKLTGVRVESKYLDSDHLCVRDGHGSGVRIHFLRKTRPGFGMFECKVHVCKSMAEMGRDSESKIWRLIGFGAGSGFLVFGSGFGVNFSNSAHLCSVWML